MICGSNLNSLSISKPNLFSWRIWTHLLTTIFKTRSSKRSSACRFYNINFIALNQDVFEDWFKLALLVAGLSEISREQRVRMYKTRRQFVQLHWTNEGMCDNRRGSKIRTFKSKKVDQERVEFPYNQLFLSAKWLFIVAVEPKNRFNRLVFDFFFSLETLHSLRTKYWFIWKIALSK